MPSFKDTLQWEKRRKNEHNFHKLVRNKLVTQKTKTGSWLIEHSMGTYLALPPSCDHTSMVRPSNACWLTVLSNSSRSAASCSLSWNSWRKFCPDHLNHDQHSRTMTDVNTAWGIVKKQTSRVTFQTRSAAQFLPLSSAPQPSSPCRHRGPRPPGSPRCCSPSPAARVANPDLIGSVDPDSESGSRRAKITHKSRKKLKKFMFWSAGCSLLRAECFFCSLDVLNEGHEIGKL